MQRNNYLIIGGSSGIGRELALRLSEQYRVYATFRNHDPGEGTDRLSYHHLDLQHENPDWTFLPETLSGVAVMPGRIQLKPFNRIKPADFVADFEAQVVGPMSALQVLAPLLKNSGSGSVVLFSTIAVQRGFSYHSLVSSSKGAIEGLTRALAAEWAPVIRVNCIAPSLTDTPLAAALLNSPEKIQQQSARHPMKRIGSASDLASLAYFLLTGQSSWITGQVIHADGGLSSLSMV
ncbi:MAG: SDR family oxidoreductase [Cyclobacteriaceae bacterium]|nr:SDR family oxidoreductase [Cyclobacteriaceae bacterium]